MDLAHAFNSREYRFSKQTDQVLAVKYQLDGYSSTYYYDFLNRITSMRLDSYPQYQNVTPFAQADREVLVAMRDKLIELGGKPFELPAETPVGPAKPRALNP